MRAMKVLKNVREARGRREMNPLKSGGRSLSTRCGAMFAERWLVFFCALREIWAIQAFVKEFCLPREGGEKTRVQTKAKRWVAELHTLAQPWIRALTRAVRIPALERLADLIQSADEVEGTISVLSCMRGLAYRALEQSILGRPKRGELGRSSTSPGP